MLAMIDLIFALAAVLVWLALPFAILAGYFVGEAPHGQAALSGRLVGYPDELDIINRCWPTYGRGRRHLDNG